AQQVALRIEAGVKFGALSNPLADDGDLIFRQPTAAVLGGHAGTAGRRNELINQAFFRLAGRDGIVLVAAFAETFVRRHVQLALPFLGIMASEAVFLEYGRDIVDKTLGWRLRACWRQRHKENHAETYV